MTVDLPLSPVPSSSILITELTESPSARGLGAGEREMRDSLELSCIFLQL